MSLYCDLLTQPHVLIGGTTGSGKSVFVDKLICTALCKGSGANQLILIDLKKVELREWKRAPHTLMYADTTEEAVKALNYALNLIEKRYKRMQRKRLKKYNGSNVYIVIDEFADLMTTAKKQVKPLVQRIGQIGRAANVHLIVATQCPIVSVIPTEIKVNFDARVGLRTRNAQDSRNIIGVNGCELLPQYGQAYCYTPQNGLELWNITPYPDDLRKEIHKRWHFK